MKRSGFKPKGWEPKPVTTVSEVFTVRPREVAKPLRANDGKARAVVQVPKSEPLQHKGYMALVRKLPCAMCGIQGFTQFCHADQGKGMAIKSDCRLGWPGCGPNNGQTGCHYWVGTSGRLSKEQRRSLEARAGRRTRDAIRASGQWPKRLPDWIETD